MDLQIYSICMDTLCLLNYFESKFDLTVLNIYNIIFVVNPWDISTKYIFAKNYINSGSKDHLRNSVNS